jgi:hypothetical protein
VASQVHSEKPDFTVEQVLDEAANRTRKLLGIRRVVRNESENLGNPAFVNTKGEGKPPVGRKTRTQQDEIDEFLTH